MAGVQDPPTNGQFDDVLLDRYIAHGQQIENHLWTDITNLNAMLVNAGQLMQGSTYQLSDTANANIARSWTLYNTTSGMGSTLDTIRDAIQFLCRHPPEQADRLMRLSRMSV